MHNLKFLNFVYNFGYDFLNAMFLLTTFHIKKKTLSNFILEIFEYEKLTNFSPIINFLHFDNAYLNIKLVFES